MCRARDFVPRYRRSKMQKKFSLRNLANFLLNKTHFKTIENVKSCFIRTTFRLVIIEQFGTSSKILKLKDLKSVVWNILPIIEKDLNGPLKIKNSKIRARHTNSILL